MSSLKKKSTFIKPELSVEELSTALFQANLRLEKANHQLQESERIRLEMFSNVSHDLRSPITTLRSYVEYLLSFDKLDEKEVFSTLNQMHSKILSLDHLMNELFFITSLDSQTQEHFNCETIQIGMYLEDFFYSCEADKKYNDRHLILKVPTHFPYYAPIDTRLLSRVLDNLFTNALKYSFSGDSITLNAYCQQTELIISIADTGIGIAQCNLELIFNRTFMVSDARTPNASSGCGLGLSIAQSIIAKHQGRIWCESTLNEGSIFYISLPLIESK